MAAAESRRRSDLAAVVGESRPARCPARPTAAAPPRCTRCDRRRREHRARGADRPHRRRHRADPRRFWRDAAAQPSSVSCRRAVSDALGPASRPDRSRHRPLGGDARRCDRARPRTTDGCSAGAGYEEQLDQLLAFAGLAPLSDGDPLAESHRGTAGGAVPPGVHARLEPRLGSHRCPAWPALRVRRLFQPRHRPRGAAAVSQRVRARASRATARTRSSGSRWSSARTTTTLVRWRLPWYISWVRGRAGKPGPLMSVEQALAYSFSEAERAAKVKVQDRRRRGRRLPSSWPSSWPSTWSARGPTRSSPPPTRSRSRIGSRPTSGWRS